MSGFWNFSTSTAKVLPKQDCENIQQSDLITWKVPFLLAKATMVRTELITPRTAAMDTYHSTRFAALLMSWTQHYICHKARFNFQICIQFFNLLKAKTGYSSSDTTYWIIRWAKLVCNHRLRLKCVELRLREYVLCFSIHLKTLLCD